MATPLPNLPLTHYQFCIELKRVREYHGLSYRQVAKDQPYTYGLFYNVETGRDKPSLIFIKSLFDTYPNETDLLELALLVRLGDLPVRKSRLVRAVKVLVGLE